MMREKTRNKYMESLTYLQENKVNIHRNDLTSKSREFFGNFVTFYYLNKLGFLKYNDKSDSFMVDPNSKVENILGEYEKKQHDVSIIAAKKHKMRISEKLFNSEINRHMTETLNQMPTVFSSNEFNNALCNKGEYKRYVKNGGALAFLKKHCIKHITNRMWQKKNETNKKDTIRISSKINPIIEILESKPDLSQFSADQLVKELRDRGYTVICKKITEIEI